MDDAVPFIIFLFIAAFSLFFFSINEEVKSKNLVENAQYQKNILFGHQVLMGYINEVNKQGGTKADFILKYISEKDYNIIKKDLVGHFSEILGNIDWHIGVKDSSGNMIFPYITPVQYSPEYSSGQASYLAASVIIPISGAKPNYISIELFFR